MPAPTEYPEWATDSTTDPTTGAANKVQPKESFKNTGLLEGEPLARAHLNYQFDCIDQWIKSLEASMSPLDATSLNALQIGEVPVNTTILLFQNVAGTFPSDQIFHSSDLRECNFRDGGIQEPFDVFISPNSPAEGYWQRILPTSGIVPIQGQATYFKYLGKSQTTTNPLPRWASEDLSPPNKIDPPEERQESGFLRNTPHYRTDLNYQFDLISDWLEWFYENPNVEVSADGLYSTYSTPIMLNNTGSTLSINSAQLASGLDQIYISSAPTDSFSYIGDAVEKDYTNKVNNLQPLYSGPMKYEGDL